MHSRKEGNSNRPVKALSIIHYARYFDSELEVSSFHMGYFMGFKELRFKNLGKFCLQIYNDCSRIIWARTLRTYIENKWTLAGLRIASFGADSQPFCVGYSHTIMDTANNCAFIIIFQLAGLLNLVASEKWLHLWNNKGTLSGGHFLLATK